MSVTHLEVRTCDYCGKQETHVVSGKDVYFRGWIVSPGDVVNEELKKKIKDVGDSERRDFCCAFCADVCAHIKYVEKNRKRRKH